MTWTAGQQAVTESVAGSGIESGNQAVYNDSDSPGQDAFSTQAQNFTYNQNWSRNLSPGGQSSTSSNNVENTATTGDSNGTVSSSSSTIPGTTPGYLDSDMPFPINALGKCDSDYAPDPMTSAAGFVQSTEDSQLVGGVQQANAATVDPTTSPSPSIIQPQTEITPPARSYDARVNSNAPVGAGNDGFTYNSSQLSGNWTGNFGTALFHPSTFGSAESDITTPA